MRIVDDEKWAPLIGHFMLAFGSIESSVNRILQHWCSLQTLLFVRSISLEQRVTLVKSLALEQAFGDENRAVLIANLNDLRSLTTTRNLIAHSPLTLMLFTEEDADDHGVKPLREVIFSEHKEKHISYEKLAADVTRARRVAEALMQNKIELGWHGRRLNPFEEDLHVASLERA